MSRRGDGAILKTWRGCVGQSEENAATPHSAPMKRAAPLWHKHVLLKRRICVQRKKHFADDVPRRCDIAGIMCV
jgi:hypothetical protein